MLVETEQLDSIHLYGQYVFDQLLVEHFIKGSAQAIEL